MASTTTNKCGYCDGVFNKREENAPLQFYKWCILCNQKYRIKSNCANEMYKRSTQNNKADVISVVDFNNSQIKLYCIQCKQKQCFYCTKIHKSEFKLILYFKVKKHYTYNT